MNNVQTLLKQSMIAKAPYKGDSSDGFHTDINIKD